MENVGAFFFLCNAGFNMCAKGSSPQASGKIGFDGNRLHGIAALSFPKATKGDVGNFYRVSRDLESMRGDAPHPAHRKRRSKAQDTGL
jgi:hypothetical protein